MSGSMKPTTRSRELSLCVPPTNPSWSRRIQQRTTSLSSSSAPSSSNNVPPGRHLRHQISSQINEEQVVASSAVTIINNIAGLGNRQTSSGSVHPASATVPASVTLNESAVRPELGSTIPLAFTAKRQSKSSASAVVSAAATSTQPLGLAHAKTNHIKVIAPTSIYSITEATAPTASLVAGISPASSSTLKLEKVSNIHSPAPRAAFMVSSPVLASANYNSNTPCGHESGPKNAPCMQMLHVDNPQMLPLPRIPSGPPPALRVTTTFPYLPPQEHAPLNISATVTQLHSAPSTPSTPSTPTNSALITPNTATALVPEQPLARVLATSIQTNTHDEGAVWVKNIVLPSPEASIGGSQGVVSIAMMTKSLDEKNTQLEKEKKKERKRRKEENRTDRTEHERLEHEAKEREEQEIKREGRGYVKWEGDKREVKPKGVAEEKAKEEVNVITKFQVESEEKSSLGSETESKADSEDAYDAVSLVEPPKPTPNKLSHNLQCVRQELQLLSPYPHHYLRTYTPTYSPPTQSSSPYRSDSELSSVDSHLPDPGSNSRTILFQPIRQNTISRFMPLAEVITHLGDHGCQDITEQLDPESSSNYPITNGGFGDLYKGMLYNKTPVAIKTMRLCVISTSEGTKHFKDAAHELYTWSKCDHSNVLKLLGLVRFRGQIGMVSPWMEHGDLHGYLFRNPEVDRCRISTQMCDGIVYLHDHGIVHGDLKGANVLMSSDGTAVLADFGNATLRDCTLKFTTTTSSISLSIRWSAPELFEQYAKYSMEADVYALGMTILETFTGNSPYREITNNRAVYGAVMRGKIPVRPNDTISPQSKHGDKLWRLLKSCWSCEPKQRPSAKEAADTMRTIKHKGMLRE